MASREYDMTARAAAAGRTRDRLLRAARDGFGDRRYDDVTLAGIARAAGVTVQTLLNHFGYYRSHSAHDRYSYAVFTPYIDFVSEQEDLRELYEYLNEHK